MGDHASSAATSDPSFWSIHPTVERWLQLLRLEDWFTSESWSPELFLSNVHPNLDSDHCVGHHPDDMLVFGDVDGFTFTNLEYYTYISPKTPFTPYVYDNFEWPHCEKLGIHINKADQY